jgi:hypothetical protein
MVRREHPCQLAFNLVTEDGREQRIVQLRCNPRDVMRPMTTADEIRDNLRAVIDAYDAIGIDLHTLHLAAMGLESWIIKIGEQRKKFAREIAEANAAAEELERERLAARSVEQGTGPDGGDSDGDDPGVATDGAERDA